MRKRAAKLYTKKQQEDNSAAQQRQLALQAVCCVHCLCHARSPLLPPLPLPLPRPSSVPPPPFRPSTCPDPLPKRPPLPAFGYPFVGTQPVERTRDSFKPPVNKDSLEKTRLASRRECHKVRACVRASACERASERACASPRSVQGPEAWRATLSGRCVPVRLHQRGCACAIDVHPLTRSAIPVSRVAALVLHVARGRAPRPG